MQPRFSIIDAHGRAFKTHTKVCNAQHRNADANALFAFAPVTQTYALVECRFFLRHSSLNKDTTGAKLLYNVALVWRGHR
jgi:hypothetical protein